MKEVKAILIKPGVKAVVNGFLCILVSAFLGASIGVEKNRIIWIILTAVSGIAYIIALVKYAKSDKDLQQTNESLEEEKKTLLYSANVYNNAIQGISSLCKFSAKHTNIQVHEIINNGDTECKNWNFDLASSLVCETIYHSIVRDLGVKKNASDIIDIEVCYVKLNESVSEKGNVHKYANMCAHYHPASSRNPKVFRVNRDLSARKDKYHDVNLFADGNGDVNILMNSQEISRYFKLQRYKDYDYSQYIGIPIICDSTNQGKMVGLLEIVCHGDSIISNEKKKILQYVNCFFAPYAQLLLLLFKLEKALKAIPKNKKG